jgi:hypothetical protein
LVQAERAKRRAAELRRRPPTAEIRLRTRTDVKWNAPGERVFWKLVAGLTLHSTCWHLVAVVTSEGDEYLPIRQLIEFLAKSAGEADNRS